MADLQSLKYPAHYTQICMDELYYVEGGSVAETVDTLYKIGRVFTYVGRIFTAIGSMFNAINTIYTSVENLNKYIEKNF